MPPGDAPHGQARELAIPLSRLDSGTSAPLSSNEGATRGPALAGQFNYVAPETRPYPQPIAFLRRYAFRIFLLVTFGGTVLILFCTYFAYGDHDSYLGFLPCNKAWKDLFKYMSIPVVSIVFTWWHVWLGIKMCFYPVEFIGCCKPYLGWQGIVPRRAQTMATRSCDIMIGTLITVEEIIDRVEPQDFFSSLENVIGATSTAVVTRVATRRFPSVWAQLPEQVKDELNKKVVEESQRMFQPVINDLKTNINQIVDIKQMAVDVLVSNKPLLVAMFQEIGNREFVFIQHVAAVMGFVLGIIQMMLWLILNSSDGECDSHSHAFKCWGGFVILPVSGLIIGYFTNWLGITMIFRPVEPHIMCGGYVNIQGVFLKRQQEVSKELTTMICTHLVHAHKMMEYILKRSDVVDRVLEIYQRHMNEAFEEVMGRARTVLPILVGQGAIDGIKQEVMDETIAELPNHATEIEAYMDRAFGLRDTLAYRLARLPPDRFEGMLHPVFQEDEWMVLLLGGVLGVVVGSLQAFALGS